MMILCSCHVCVLCEVEDDRTSSWIGEAAAGGGVTLIRAPARSAEWPICLRQNNSQRQTYAKYLSRNIRYKIEIK